MMNYLKKEEMMKNCVVIFQKQATKRTDSDSTKGNDRPISGWHVYNAADPDFIKIPFNLNSGYKPPANEKPESELQFLQLFLTDELSEQIVKETNRYAKEKIQQNTPLQKRSIWSTWRDVTLAELKAFIGVIILYSPTLKSKVKIV